MSVFGAALRERMPNDGGTGLRFFDPGALANGWPFCTPLLPKPGVDVLRAAGTVTPLSELIADAWSPPNAR